MKIQRYRPYGRWFDLDPRKIDAPDDDWSQTARYRADGLGEVGVHSSRFCDTLFTSVWFIYDGDRIYLEEDKACRGLGPRARLVRKMLAAFLESPEAVKKEPTP